MRRERSAGGLWVWSSAGVVLTIGLVAWMAFRGGEPAVAPSPARPTQSRILTPVPPPPVLPPAPVPPADLPPPVDLDGCDRDRDLFGTTVDEVGLPVPGARVQAFLRPWRRSNMAPASASSIEEEGPSTVSAGDGSFVLHLERGQQFDLRATAEGYGQGDMDHCLAGQRVLIVLRRGGGSVTVHCVDEEGGSVSGVRVRLWSTQRLPSAVSAEVSREGETGADGRIAFRNLPPFGGNLRAVHPRFGEPAWVPLQFPSTGDLPLTVVLPTGRPVSGRVTDSATGVPLPGASVGANWTRARPVPTDADGRYTFPGWTGRDGVGLTASAPGYASLQVRVPPEGDLDFALEPAFSARGRVVDAMGNPVPGARVAASGALTESSRQALDRAMATSGPDGEFRLPDLSYRFAHDLSVEAAGHGRIAASFEPPASWSRVLELGDLTLSAPLAIEGRAIGSAGEALPRRNVGIGALRPGGPRKGKDADADRFLPGTFESRRTDDLGRFRFPGLSPGRWEVILSEPGTPDLRAQVELTGEGDILDLELRRQGRSITFLLTSSGGRPLAGIAVVAKEESPSAALSGAEEPVAISGPDGRAVFSGLPTGVGAFRFRIQPYGDKDAPPWARVETEPLEPAGQEVRVTLQPVALLRGRILDSAGLPVPGLLVLALDEGGAAFPGSADASDGEGRFALAVLPGRRVTIEPGGDGRWALDGAPPVVTTPAEGIEMRVSRIREDRSLRVLVLDDAGRVVSGAVVVARDAAASSGTGVFSGKTDAGGGIRWEGLSGRALTLTVNPPADGDWPEDLVPPATETVIPAGQNHVLRFRRGVRVTGRVLLPDGMAAAGARVWFTNREGGVGSAPDPRTDREGRFRFWMGEEQVVRVSATAKDAEGSPLHGQSGEVRVGDVEVEIPLGPGR